MGCTWLAGVLHSSNSRFIVGPAVLSNTLREGRFEMIGLEFGVGGQALGCVQESLEDVLFGSMCCVLLVQQ